MAHATFPAVYYDEVAGEWICEMRDKKTGRTWGKGHGATRQEAIYNARHDQPAESKIKRAIGWVARHPFVAGATVGVYLAYRRGRYHRSELKLIDYLSAGVIIGTLAWGLSRLYNLKALTSE